MHTLSTPNTQHQELAELYGTAFDPGAIIPVIGNISVRELTEDGWAMAYYTTANPDGTLRHNRVFVNPLDTIFLQRADADGEAEIVPVGGDGRLSREQAIRTADGTCDSLLSTIDRLFGNQLELDAQAREANNAADRDDRLERAIEAADMRFEAELKLAATEEELRMAWDALFDFYKQHRLRPLHPPTPARA